MSNGQTSPPDAAGDLTKYPFPRLLFFLFRKSFTGRLLLELPGKWRGTVYFRQGMAVRADIPTSQDVLGRVLLERGLIKEDAFNQSLQKLSAGEGLQGQILKQMGALDSAGLVEGLNLQLRRKLMRVFPLLEVRFQLFAGEHEHGLDEESSQVYADPFRVIYHGVKHFYSLDHLTPELAKLKNKILQLKPAFSKFKDRFAMREDEQPLLTLLQHSPLGLDDIQRVSNLSPGQTNMLVYILWITDLLDTSRQADARPAPVAPLAPDDDGLPPSMGQAQAAAAPRGTATGDGMTVESYLDHEEDDLFLPPAKHDFQPRHESGNIEPLPFDDEEPEEGALPDSIMASMEVDTSSLLAKTKAGGALRRQIKETYERIKNANYYDVLGVGQDASPDSIRDNYFQLAKVFHPDRANALGLRDVAPLAEDIFSRISEAHNVLSNEASRTEYNDKLQGNNQKQDIINAVEAEFIFQKGIVYFRKKDYDKALKHFEQAFRLNSREGDHLAYMAWTLYTDPRRDRFRTYETVMEQMEKALTISPRSATIHFFLGELFAAKGNDKEAARYFNLTLDINPDHMEAERHLRLIKIRQDKRRASSEKKMGFLSRFLSKDGEGAQQGDKGDKGKKGGKDKDKKPAKKKWY